MTDTMDRRAKILEKVEKLLQKAASTNFDEESKIYQAKADELMTEWAIEEFELGKANPRDPRYKPEKRRFDFQYLGDYTGYWNILFAKLVRHCRCIQFGRDVYGYPGDLDYLQSLSLSLQLHMAGTMDPKPDPLASEGKNLYAMRMAGYNWEKIHRLMYPDVPWERRHGVRYTNVVKRYATENDLPVNKSASASNYRINFADAYTYRIGARLAELEDEREKASGGGLVLANRASDLKEFFWAENPAQRPHPKDCDCDTCHYVRCHDPKCQRPRCVEGRKPVRRTGRTRYISRNATAYAAGQRAANSANLGQTGVAGGARKEVG